MAEEQPSEFFLARRRQATPDTRDGPFSDSGAKFDVVVSNFLWGNADGAAVATLTS